MATALRFESGVVSADLVLQLRNAFALATILNRTLILPQLWCGLDRYWAPHSGTLPGSEFKLPFVCPADHVLDIESEYQVLSYCFDCQQHNG